MTRGYRSWFRDLINVWTIPATMLKNKLRCRQFIHSAAFVKYKSCTCLRPLYLYFPNTPRIYSENISFMYIILCRLLMGVMHTVMSGFTTS